MPDQVAHRDTLNCKECLPIKKKQTSKLPEGSQPAKSLTQVLKDSELVRGMVKESADELASVNLVLNEEL